MTQFSSISSLGSASRRYKSSRSLKRCSPAIAHQGHDFAGAFAVWQGGPLRQREVGRMGLIAATLIAVAAFGILGVWPYLRTAKAAFGLRPMGWIVSKRGAWRKSSAGR